LSRLPPRSDDATAVHANAAFYHDRLKSFFKTPDNSLNLECLADFLHYKPHQEKIETPTGNRLATLMQGIKFYRDPVVAQAGTAPSSPQFLNTLIAQSDHQNQVTAKFLALLR
jgi:hypothetical protein